MNTAKIIKVVVAAVIVVVALSVIFGSLFTVEENEFGVVKQFGKITSVKNEAGIYFKIPFVDEVSTLPDTKLVYDIPPSELLTGDAKSLVVDNYVVWQITDPITFIQRVGTVSEMERRLDATIYSVVKNTLGRTEQADIISAGEGARNELNTVITEEVNESLRDEYGVTVVSVEIKKLDLPEANESAVYNRMISDRQQIAAALTAEGELEAAKIKNETDKKATIIVSQAEAEAERIKGEAEAEYMKILAEAFDTPEKEEFYDFIRSLEAAEVSMKDGRIVLILSGDNPLARIFAND